MLRCSTPTCTTLLTHPPPRSFLLMLCLYWVTALALLGFAYCLTTLFSKARVAGTATALIYLAAMVPG